MERDNQSIEPACIRQRFTRALNSYDRHAVAQQRISAEAAKILSLHLQPFGRCLEIGCGTGGFTRHLQRMLPNADWVLNDLCGESLAIAATHCNHSPQSIIGDAENTELGIGYDLIASTSAFQWFHDPLNFIKKLAGMQTKGGVLLFSTFSPGNLQEVKEAAGKGLSYPSGKQWEEWLAPFYNIEVCREEAIRLTFGSPLEVLRHLKYTGVTATHNGQWTRGMQEDFVRRYKQQFSTDNNQVTLTYRPLYLLAKRL
ncbi:malonyl-ACP O-methyltransferase BioC [Parabacteroides chinchillae]|uniref:Malonyl-[acyl-carrier protein] O-methyltransferase n=1 Tax=Parabacteroides chinchillae TaxID=871327 RepID=A0A8G2F4T6_9BACT|nr:malonyl-ACP O-methyltransferase BioC [Parabacteroides chinchillae]SEG03903.1 malonyl-CoA O-methyltransferase [Parabacteroides chinchillae]